MAIRRNFKAICPLRYTSFAGKQQLNSTFQFRSNIANVRPNFEFSVAWRIETALLTILIFWAAYYLLTMRLPALSQGLEVRSNVKRLTWAWLLLVLRISLILHRYLGSKLAI